MVRPLGKEKLATYGMDEPNAVVTLETGDKTITLRVGAKDPDDNSYVVISSESPYYVRVYYNLGNVYFKQEKLGLAILNYERAHHLMPRDEDIKTNLAYARSQIVDKIETPDPGLLGRWLASLQGLLTIDETTILAWVLYLIMTVLALLFVSIPPCFRLVIY